MQLIVKGVALFALSVLLIPTGFAKSPAKKNADDPKNTDDTTSTALSADAKADDTTSTTNSDPKADETPAPESVPVATPAAQKAAGNTMGDDMADPKFTPMLGTTGTIGVFTVETGQTLPKGGFNFSAFGNKFGRMPGSVTMFQVGLDASYGITDHLSVYAVFDAYQHAHVGCGPQLSLAPPNNAGAPYPHTIYHTLSSGTQCNSVTPSGAFDAGTPGFVEDFPLVSGDQGGLGPVTVGLKYGLLSERDGAPVSLSIRNDFIFGTHTHEGILLSNGTQASPFSDWVSGALSKQWSNVVTVSFNAGFLLTRDPRDYNSNHLLTMADQFRAGAGFILFPESRFQPMMEYTGVKFLGASTPDTVFGAAIPSMGSGECGSIPGRTSVSTSATGTC